MTEKDEEGASRRLRRKCVCVCVCAVRRRQGVAQEPPGVVKCFIRHAFHFHACIRVFLYVCRFHRVTMLQYF